MSSLRPTKHRRFLLGFCMLVAVGGCGQGAQQIKDRASLSGKVTFNGQPLPAGTIGLESTTGQATTAISIREGGVYSTDRAPIGKNLVTVDTASIQLGSRAAYVPIPEKYNNSRTSELIVDVKPGVNENVDFVLVK